MRLVSILLSVALGVACADPRDSASAIDAPVVLVSVDTLRSDRLPVYGYEKVETPRLDEFAAGAVLFERAYSHYPLTLPSHASLLTGLLPPHHGVRDNRGFILDERHTTLAERLREAGYETAGFVSSAVLREATGVGQGFDVFDDAIEVGPARGARLAAERSGDSTLDAVSEWLDDRDPARPFFLFVHLYEPHAPYDAREPFASRHEDPYDAEIAWTDALMGRLIEELSKRHLFDSSLIVFLSDHGEGLEDHGELEHGLLLYREALQVPMLIRLPAGRLGGLRLEEPVGLFDVMPTVLALVGLDEPVETDGQAVLGPARPVPGRALYAESFFSRYQYGWSETRSVIRDQWHYIEAPQPELFDMLADAREMDNLAYWRDPPSALVRSLAEIGSGTEARASVDPESRELLESLGYVGGSTTSRGPTVIDPKTVVRHAEELWSFVYDRGPPRDSVTNERLRELLAFVGIGNEYLYRTLARTLLHEGRTQFAREILEPFLESTNAETLVVLGQTLADLGETSAAAAGFEQALEIDDRNGEALLGLALLEMSAGRYDVARERLERAVELEPGLAEAWNGLGVIHMNAGDRRRAIEAWVQALEIEPELSDAWFNLALARHRAGDRRGAADALRRYMELVDGTERRQAAVMLRELNEGT